MGNKHGKEGKTKTSKPDTVDGTKVKVGSNGSTKKGGSRVKNEQNESRPDLGGAVPYRKYEDEPKVTVTIYRSIRDLRRHPSEIPPSRSDVNIKIHRKSSAMEPEKPQTLPRNFGRSKSATMPSGRGALTHGDDAVSQSSLTHMSMRRRIDSANQRPVKSASKKNNLERNSAQFIVPVKVTDLPDTTAIKEKISQFQKFFCKFVLEKYSELSGDVQLRCLTVAFHRAEQHTRVSLFDYLNDDQYRGVNLADRVGIANFAVAVPEAMLQGTEHVRRGNERSLDTQLPLVNDLLMCVAMEAADELSRIYEYQISLMYDDVSMKILATQAADCVIYSTQGGIPLDRNLIIHSVVYTYPPNEDDRPKFISAVIGDKELKWNLFEIFKRPGLRLERSLTGKEYPREMDIDLDPWTFHYNSKTEPFLYGYRGQLLKWDFFSCVYVQDLEELQQFTKEIAFQDEDIHRLYKPYKRLFGRDFFIRYYREHQRYVTENVNSDLAKTTLKDVLKLRAFGSFKEIDDICPVFRPLEIAPFDIDFTTFDSRGVDMNRAKSWASTFRPTHPKPQSNGYGHKLVTANGPLESISESSPQSPIKQQRLPNFPKQDVQGQVRPNGTPDRQTNAYNVRTSTPQYTSASGKLKPSYETNF